jgi:hypothetical protein
MEIFRHVAHFIMVLLLQPLFGSAGTWRHLLNTAMPDIEVRIWPELGNPADIEVALYDAISRVAPATRSFEFHSAKDFVEKVTPIIYEWSASLAGRTFHIRLHRRGAKYDLGTTPYSRVI